MKKVFLLCFVFSTSIVFAQFKISNIRFDTSRGTLVLDGYNQGLGGTNFTVTTGIATDTNRPAFQLGRSRDFSDTTYLTTDYTNVKNIVFKRLTVSANTFVYFSLANMSENIPYVFEVKGFAPSSAYVVKFKSQVGDVLLSERGVVSSEIAKQRDGTYTLTRVGRSVFLSCIYEPISDVKYTPYYITQSSGSIIVSATDVVRRFNSELGDINIYPNNLGDMVDERVYKMIYESNTANNNLNFLTVGSQVYRRVGFSDVSSFSTKDIGVYDLKKVGNIIYVEPTLEAQRKIKSVFSDSCRVGIGATGLINANSTLPYDITWVGTVTNPHVLISIENATSALELKAWTANITTSGFRAYINNPNLTTDVSNAKIHWRVCRLSAGF
jgi:hypothetical protein